MKARIQDHINQHDDADEDLNHFPTGFFKVVELTKQQKELLVLGDELKKNVAEHNSPFQNFLKYSPDALRHFFYHLLIFKSKEKHILISIYLILIPGRSQKWIYLLQ